MKLLLTSNGLSNDSIAETFADLIGKDPKDAKVAFILTAANPERDDKGWLIDDLYRIKQRGYFVDIIDLTAFDEDKLRKIISPMDAVFVGGGSSFYLSYWMDKSGMIHILKDFMKDKVYAGISAGSMVAGASLLPSDALEDLQAFRDDHYYDNSGRDESYKDQSSYKTLNYVNIVFRPHFNSPTFPKVRKEVLEQVVDKLPAPLYALDDESALKVVNGNIEVITEGDWLVLNKKGVE